MVDTETKGRHSREHINSTYEVVDGDAFPEGTFTDGFIGNTKASPYQNFSDDRVFRTYPLTDYIPPSDPTRLDVHGMMDTYGTAGLFGSGIDNDSIDLDGFYEHGWVDITIQDTVSPLTDGDVGAISEDTDGSGRVNGATAWFDDQTGGGIGQSFFLVGFTHENQG